MVGVGEAPTHEGEKSINRNNFPLTPLTGSIDGSSPAIYGHVTSSKTVTSPSLSFLFVSGDDNTCITGLLC